MEFLRGKMSLCLLVLVAFVCVQHFQGLQSSAMKITVCRPCQSGRERPISVNKWNEQLDAYGCPPCVCPVRDCRKECRGGEFTNGQDESGCASCNCGGYRRV